MKDFLRHLFLPRESNNHRAKLLHHKSLLFVIIFFLVGQVILATVKQNYQQVLGSQTDISSQTLLVLTNKDREQVGLMPLRLNDALAKAALSKAKYMFVNNYWAHNAPDGTTPWVFIKQAGYDYTYAGENLARGFATSDDVVKAWMASPTHKENMLSSNYQDIGFAILDGKLLGEDTTLVVEMFGNTKLPVATKQTSQAAQVPGTIPQKVVYGANVPSSLPVSVEKKPFMDSFSLSWRISIFTLLLFVSILVLDMIIVERKKIARLVGHNLDHIIFLGLILLFVALVSRGVTL